MCTSVTAMEINTTVKIMEHTSVTTMESDIYMYTIVTMMKDTSVTEWKVTLLFWQWSDTSVTAMDSDSYFSVMSSDDTHWCDGNGKWQYCICNGDTSVTAMDSDSYTSVMSSDDTHWCDGNGK